MSSSSSSSSQTPSGFRLLPEEERRYYGFRPRRHRAVAAVAVALQVIPASLLLLCCMLIHPYHPSSSLSAAAAAAASDAAQSTTTTREDNLHGVALDDTANQQPSPPQQQQDPRVHGQEDPRRHRRRLNPNTSTADNPIRALVLLVQFPDHAGRPLPPKSYFEELCNGNGPSSFSIKRYFEQQSAGQYFVQCHVQDWMVTNGTEAFFGAGDKGFRGSVRSADFFVPALEQLDATAGGIDDWALFDQNGDGLLDSVLVLHSGYGAELAGGLECNANPSDFRIRSQGWIRSLEGAWTSKPFPINNNNTSSNSSSINGSDNNDDNLATVQLDGYAVASAYDDICSTNVAEMGVMVHEWIHTVGGLDVYDTSTGKIGGLGSFDIMANPFGPRGDASLPGSMSPFSKLQTGWLTPQPITSNGVYSIRASNLYPDCYIIETGFPAGEYLLIENRQPVEFDGLLFGNGGLLIYHVDDAVEWLQERAGYPGQPGWPSNGDHYRVALLQADGRYDLERGVNNGDAADLWTQGMTLGPGNGVTFPNTDAYQNGIIVQTNIVISDISASGMTMTFRVSGLGGETPSPTKTPTRSPTKTPTTTAPTTLPSETTFSPDADDSGHDNDSNSTSSTMTTAAPTTTSIPPPPTVAATPMPSSPLPPPPPPSSSSTSSSASLFVGYCHCCWTMTALAVVLAVLG